MTPPYVQVSDNRLLKITQSMYVLLNGIFMVNIFSGQNMTNETRYFFVGYALIFVVLCIILSNIGFSFYLNIITLISKCRKKRNRVHMTENPPQKPKLSAVQENKRTTRELQAEHLDQTVEQNLVQASGDLEGIFKPSEVVPSPTHEQPARVDEEKKEHKKIVKRKPKTKRINYIK